MHDWGDAKAIEILKQIKPAMAPYSRILLKETVLPEKNISAACAMVDLNMMVYGSIERTASDWNIVVRSAGMQIEKIWYDIGAPHNTAIIEIRQ